MDDFEQFLKRQPVRALPREWRAGILAAAVDARREQLVKRDEETASPSTPWWLVWLLPSRAAWAGVACAWVVILGLDAASRPDGATSARGSEGAQQNLAMLVERQQWLQQFCLRMERESAEPSRLPINPRRQEPPGAFNWRNAETQIA